MSIATELQRIETAKANLKTQIEAKGVSVPSTATIDTYATYVQQIPQGGGSGGTTDYFKITDLSHSNLVYLQFSRTGYYGDDLKIKASTDGENWTSYSISGSGAGIQIYIPEDGYVLLDGSENKMWSYDKDNYWNMGFNGPVKLSGKLSSLVSKDASNVCFARLFVGQNKIKDASELILDYDYVQNYGYYLMFQSCTGMTGAPTILATTFGDSACGSMFEGCYSLIAAPTIQPNSYTGSKVFLGAFLGCSSLTATQSAFTFTKMGDNVCQKMFSKCKSLTTAPALPATIISTYCYESMFAGCTSLTSAPALPATALQTYCYQSMFAGCTGLTSAPILSADRLTGNCYTTMFSGCTSLSSITCLATTGINSTNTKNWVQGISTTGTLYVASGATSSWTQGNNGYPATWTIEEYTPPTPSQ